MGPRRESLGNYERLITYLDRQVSKAVLGQTLTTDQGSTGSLAQAKVHDEVRADLMRADARALAATLTRDLIRPLMALNMPDAPTPQFTLLVEEPEDMDALADQIAKLVPLGMPVPQAWVREKWGIPEAVEGEPILGPPAGHAEPPGGAASAATPNPDAAHRRLDGAGPDPVQTAPPVGAGTSAHAATAAAPDALDELVAEALADWQPQMTPMVDPLQALFERASTEGWTAQQLIDALPGVLDTMDAGALAEALAKAAFVARLAGVHGREADNAAPSGR